MSRYAVLIAGVLAAICAMSSSRADEDPCDRVVEMDRTQAPMRPSIPGALRVGNCGIQIHPHCFKVGQQYELKRAAQDEARTKAEALKAGRTYVPREPRARTRAQWEEIFSRWVKRSVDRTLGSCRTRYPELEPYLAEWATQLRRTVILCTNKTSREYRYDEDTQKGAAAVNYVHLSAARKDMSRAESAGMDWPSNSEASLPSQFKTTIGMSSTLVGDILTRHYHTFKRSIGTPDAALIHEVLHSTEANNLSEHNYIENISADHDSTGCAADMSHDRIVMLTAICSQEPVGSRYADEIIQQRTASCGTYCTDLFSGAIESKSERRFAHSAGLPSGPACGAKPGAVRRVCQKLVEEGACRKLLKEQGPILTRFDPTLAELGSRLVDRLHSILPKFTHDLPPGLLAMFPEQTIFMLKPANRACFSAGFSLGNDGTWYVRHLAKPARTLLDNPVRRTEFGGATWGARFESARAAILAASGKGRCSAEQAQEVLKGLEELKTAADQVIAAPAMRDLLLPRYRAFAARREAARDSSSSDNSVVEREWREYSFSETDLKSTQRLRSAIGEGLYDEYLAELRKRHYLSPDVDCSLIVKRGSAGELMDAVGRLAGKPECLHPSSAVAGAVTKSVTSETPATTGQMPTSDQVR